MMSDAPILVARCNKGCVVGWSLPHVPRHEREKWLANRVELLCAH